MGKVIKIILSSVSTIVLSLIILPVLASLLLHWRPVQDFAVRRAADMLSERLQTEVTFDRVRLRLFNRVALDGLCVLDYHRDTMFYADRVVVPLRSVRPFSGTVALGDVSLDGVRFRLMQDSTRRTNLWQILQKVKRKHKKERKPFRLTAASLAISDMDFRHRKFDVRSKEYGVNFTDLDVCDFNLRVSDIVVVNDSVNLSIDSLSLRERCGLRIENLTTPRFTISGTGMHFERLRVRTPESDARLTYLYFDYPTWKSYGDFLHRVDIRAEFSRSQVDFRTIAYFAQGLRDWHSVLRDASGIVSGPVAAMRGSIGEATLRDTKLGLRFAIDGLPDVKRTRFVFDVTSLETNAADVEYILQDIARTSLGEKLPMFERAGRIGFSGRFDGLLSDFIASGDLETDLGRAAVRFNVKPSEQAATAFEGSLETVDFETGRLLGSRKIGRVSLGADVTGVFGQTFGMQARARIPKLEFNGYAYGDLALDGKFENRKFTGNIASADPNIAFDFNGDLDFSDSLPAYHFDLHLRNADLHKLNFNRRDSVSKIRCDLHAQASGTSLDNINGTVEINGMTYINHIDTVRTGNIRMEADNDSERKRLGFYSSFADAELKGKLSYGDMFSYFTHTLRSYLPSMSVRERGTAPPAPLRGEAARIDSYYLLEVDVKEANNVAGIFLPGLQLSQGTHLSFLFNPESDVFSLRLDSELIENEKFFVSDLKASCRNQADSISLFVTAADVYVKGLYMPDFSMIGGAKENRINLATRFNDAENGSYAMVSTTSTLRADSTGVPQIAVRFNPSTFSGNGQTWNIGAREIVYDSIRLKVDRFSLSNGPQRLIVDGTASRSDSDTLRLTLTDFDLRPFFSRFAERQGYRLSGYTNGSAELISAFRDGVLRAGIDFDSLQANDTPIAPLRFESKWDFPARQARFRLTNRKSGDAVVEGFYAPDEGRYQADILLRKIDMALLDPVLKGVLRGSKGEAEARLVLTNPDRKATLNGSVAVNAFSTTVDYTNVTYSMPEGTIDVRDNTMTLRPSALYDPQGHRAGFDMDFSFANPRNLTYNVHVRPENMLVLHTNASHNDLFYGTVYASGSGTIRGSRYGVSMDIVAASADGTRFYLPLGNASDISAADFIVFKDPERHASDSLAAVRRRKRLLARRIGGAQQARTDMDIKMTLDVHPNAEMQLTLDQTGDNMLRGRGSGTLNLHVNPVDKEFTIYGDYAIAEGNYRFSLQNFATRNFIIEDGSSIQWTGDPVNALLDVTAVYKLKASLAPLLGAGAQSGRRSVPVECIIRLSDRLTQPAITFDVSVPNTDPETESLVRNAMNTQEMVSTQFLWLLATQSFYSDNTAGGNSNLNIGAKGATVTGIDFLSNQLSSLLSTDRFRLAPKYRPKSEETSDEFGTEFYGELIKDRLILEGDVSYDTGNGMPVNNRTANSLTGDVTLSLLLDRAGNVKVKAFTRTIDRFDENQGLQESGVGISYRESFDNLGDVFRNIRRRTQERRRERRERKAQRQAPASGESGTAETPDTAGSEGGNPPSQQK